MCGFVGIMSTRPVAAEIYDALISIQHRGQDAAGILTYSDGQLRLEKGGGLVRDVFTPERIRRLDGEVGLGHVRYPTVGGGGAEDAQPFVTNSPFGMALVHNGNITNHHELKQALFEEGSRYVGSSCDAEVLLNVVADELVARHVRRVDPDDVFTALERSFRRVKGAYSAVAYIAGQGLVAFRDPYGIKPILMGVRPATRRGKPEFAVASESVVLSLLGFDDITDIQPGEVVFVDAERNVHRKRIAVQPHHPCIFEYVYFARPDSLLDDISVHKSRLRAGAELARRWREEDLPTDVVMPVPDSARAAAQALAGELELPYREGLVKNRYVGRTFIMPASQNRRQSVCHKLNTVPLEFEGKRVLLVDDSIVRGNTCREIIRMAREAGAIKVYWASYSPPLRHPCLYGIDMSTRDEFIARNRSIEEVRLLIGADALIYQTIEGLEKAVREGNPAQEHFCTACFTGRYPTGDVTQEMFDRWEQDRRGASQRLLPFVQIGGEPEPEEG